MSLPVNIDEYSRLVVLDDNELQQQNVAVSIRERLQRLRGIYAYWLQFPTKFDKEIVDYDIKKFNPHCSYISANHLISRTLFFLYPHFGSTQIFLPLSEYGPP